MFKLFILGFLLFSLSCTNVNNPTSSPTDNHTDTLSIDTAIYKSVITNEIAGSAYRKRATAYGLIINGDTSLFHCVFSESNSSGNITLYLNNNHPSTSYQQRFTELKHLLPIAALDYNMDSLSSISFGRFIEWGDLAVKTSDEFLVKSINTYKNLHQDFSIFLPQSFFGKEVNQLLEPYQLKIKNASLEKVFITSKENYNLNNNIETDSTKVQPNIIDCITWFTIVKK
ncbi:MAG: hypothetical protein KJZ55_08775 [Flavobacteriales bacterium]|nr:hypothetical protein [Flavobacteriales bacterium]